MKIILVNRYFFPDQSATSRVISSIGFSLAQRGFQVVALASRGIHNEDGHFLPPFRAINGVRVNRLASAGHGRRGLVRRGIDSVLFHILAFFWLLRNVSASDIVVVCTDPPLLSVSCNIAIRLRRAVMVNWIMDLFPETATELGFFGRWPRFSRWLARMRDWSLAAPGMTVCPTGKMADYLRHRGVARAQLAVMHHWSDGEEIYPVAACSNKLRSDWGLHDSFVIGYSGNFGRAHDFETMIAAAARLKHRSDIRFLLIGGGHKHASVMERVRLLQLDNVIFKPLQPVSSLAESLSVADVHLISLLPELEHCIIPSKFYGILAAGRPTIFIGDLDGEVSRVLRAKRCGDSVAIGDVDALATMIEQLRDSPETCAQMGEAARLLQVTEYSRDKAADAWCTLIGRLQKAQNPIATKPQEIA